MTKLFNAEDAEDAEESGGKHNIPKAEESTTFL
jgi:hypothetical protein